MVFLEITLSNTQLITFFYFQSFEHIYIYIYICLSQSFFLYRSLTNLLLESAPPSLIDAARALSPPARLPLKIRAVLSYELPGEVRKEATRSWKEGEGKEASVKEGTNSMIN
jgi:hypothetical protein